MHALLSIGCFTLVGVAFLLFGWKIGLLDLLLVFYCLACKSHVARIFQEEI